MNHFEISLAWCCIQVSLISLLGILLCRLAKRLGPTATSISALFSLLAIVPLTGLAFVPLPSWLDLVSDPRSESGVLQGNLDMKSIVPTRATESFVDANAGDSKQGQRPITDLHLANPWAAAAQAFFLELTAPRPTTSHARAPSRWSTVVVTIVVVGIAIGMFRLLLGWWYVQSYRLSGIRLTDPAILHQLKALCEQLGYREPIQVFETDQLDAPATIGWLRPAILFPSNWETWSSDQRQSILAHEIAHIRHRDFLAGLLSQFSLALHFYHPLVHVLVDRMRLNQELAADDVACRVAGGRSRYLRSLAELALYQSGSSVRWPARTFLPTHRTFLRRIEMLRDSEFFSRNSSAHWRLMIAGFVVIAAVSIVGLRSPWDVLPAVAQAPAAATSVASETFDTHYVTETARCIVALRPSKIFNQPLVQQTLQQVQQQMPDLKNQLDRVRQELGLDLIDVQEVIVSVAEGPIQNPSPNPPINGCIIKMSKPTDFTKVINSYAKSNRSSVVTVAYGGQTINRVVETLDPTGSKQAKSPVGFWQPDDRTLVFQSELNLQDLIGKSGQKNRLMQSKPWASIHSSDIAVGIDGRLIREMQLVMAPPANSPSAVYVATLSGFLQGVNTAALSMNLQQTASIEALFDYDTTENAIRAKETSDAMRVLALNMLRQLSKGTETGLTPKAVASGGAANDNSGRAETTRRQKPEIKNLLGMATSLLSSANVKTDGTLARATATFDFDLGLLPMIMNSTLSARNAAQSAQAQNNLKQIGLAFYNYLSVNNHFGASQNFEANGKRSPFPHSWRVALLPYIDQGALYNQYHFDEPWDSPHNLTLIDKMPPVYRHPAEDPNSKNASYFVFTGPKTIFRNEKPKLGAISDGTSNTILVVEAKREIPWTKPEDIFYQSESEIPTIGGFTSQGFNAGLADGSICFVDQNIDKTILRKYIESSDGNPVPPLQQYSPAPASGITIFGVETGRPPLPWQQPIVPVPQFR